MSSWILDFIHSMAFSCPLNLKLTGISKPYPAPLFNLFPFTLQESFEFGNFKNLYTNVDILRGIYLVHTTGISNDDQNALFGIKKNL